MGSRTPSNRDVAEHLDRIASLLEANEESPFRIRSYRNAAVALRKLRTPLAGTLRHKGENALTEIRGIGERLAGLIREFIETGSTELLTTLEKEVPPETRSQAGKNPTTKTAAAAARRPASVGTDLPVKTILEIDELYRTKSAANKLKKIAPRLMNPERKAWLPLLVTESRGVKFTVMFSNTSRAHELGKTNDWVVVYFEKGKGENQCTVVTESRGALKGKRVIRGREDECARYYAKRAAARS